ncbi:MAG TPA: hypothetical protein VFF39_13535 [Verrucomicrobiae bacterium]|nr:hypothetical protein [Verrucomicrobiae bacterium]
MKVSKKKTVRVHRSLYWANQGLIYAVNALGDLCQEPSIPHKQLRQARVMIEEARMLMNDELGEWVQRHEKP